MSSGQQQPPPRRVANVGSLLLTPQENESLFAFLGKKCVVSGRDPRRREGVGVGRGRGRRGGSGCLLGLPPPRPLAARTPLPGVRCPGAGGAGRGPGRRLRSCPGRGECLSRSPRVRTPGG